ncbi:MAG: YqaA family protein [Alphaproteobacteria bacterium]
MLGKIYNWLIEKSKHPYAVWYLGAIAFLESSVSFLPPDPMLIPMVVANRSKAWFLAFVTTMSSAAGGILGYAIGFYLFDVIGIPILKTYGLLPELAAFQNWFHKWGVWAIILKGFTPIPFKLVTITCGAIKFSFWSFLGASILSRGVRFFVEAFLLWKFGPKLNNIIQKNIMLMFVGFLVALVVGVWMLKYL